MVVKDKELLWSVSVQSLASPRRTEKDLSLKLWETVNADNAELNGLLGIMEFQVLNFGKMLP